MIRNHTVLIEPTSIETDDGEVFTAKQVKELQKRMAQLEEENLC